MKKGLLLYIKACILYTPMKKAVTIFLEKCWQVSGLCCKLSLSSLNFKFPWSATTVHLVGDLDLGVPRMPSELLQLS